MPGARHPDYGRYCELMGFGVGAGAGGAGFGAGAAALAARVHGTPSTSVSA